MTSRFDPAACRRSLFDALLDAKEHYGAKTVALEDPERNPLTYARLVLGALVLGRKLEAATQAGERVGVLLPNVQGVAVVLFGLSAFGRIPAMLNFTAGIKNLRSACETAQISTIVTSKRFIDQSKLDDVVAALGQEHRIVWTEDLRAGISTLDKLKGALSAPFARNIHARWRGAPDDAGVVLFTSGSEGLPKGVVLTHANIVTNAAQIAAHGVDVLRPDDVIFNPLPVFHSFGMTAGLMLGLLNGMKVVLYPSPLHYKQVPKLIGATKSTILLATDTFLQGYARAADEGDLTTVRYIVAGAERVKEDTRRLWAPFGTTILEGYGATECSPVLACNIPGQNRSGSVGTMLPGIAWRLDPVDGITEGGKLVVKGPNVMAGYLLASAPGQLAPPEDGWHDTGDIVVVDDNGMIEIRGRAKRFAKIAGEMVSLAAVESLIQTMWAGYNHVVVSLPDPRKGEQLVLVTDKPNADRESLSKTFKADGLPELWTPRAVLVTANIPVMGSGKIDYPATLEMARTMRPLL